MMEEAAHERINKSNSLNCKHVNILYFLIVGLILIIILMAVVILTMSLNRCNASTEKSTEKNNLHSAMTTTKDNKDILSTVNPFSSDPSNIGIGKERWGGRLPSNFTALDHPTPVVIISHTATTQCKSISQCSKRAQSLQNYHMKDLDYSDICYNFLVGSDGNIYIGRGWDVQNCSLKKSINIAFIGNYVFETVTVNMIEAIKKLLEYGVKSGKLSTDYKLIGHNQTSRTLSPGKNVYKIIQAFPHFDQNYLQEQIN